MLQSHTFIGGAANTVFSVVVITVNKELQSQRNKISNHILFIFCYRIVLTVKIRQPSHEFTFGVGMSFIPYPLVLTPVV
jgi:uncharacterized membrane protein YgaE (UPF0421/DUF939 family)